MEGGQMESKFPYVNSDKFMELNSFKRLFALGALAAAAFALTFAVLPFAGWQLHFFQAGIFASAFMFGPLAGLAVGAVSSSYNGLFVLHNPWIIAGNALLGFFAGYFFLKHGAYKAIIAAFAIQIPYVYVTDVYLMNMPQGVVLGILATLLVENAICAVAASWLSKQLSFRL